MSPSYPSTARPSKSKATLLNRSISCVELTPRRSPGPSAVIPACPDALGPRGLSHLVRDGVADGDEPSPAAEPVVPPLALSAGGVALKVEVAGPGVAIGVGIGAGGQLASEAELVDVAAPAVRTCDQEGQIESPTRPVRVVSNSLRSARLLQWREVPLRPVGPPSQSSPVDGGFLDSRLRGNDD